MSGSGNLLPGSDFAARYADGDDPPFDGFTDAELADACAVHEPSGDWDYPQPPDAYDVEELLRQAC